MLFFARCLNQANEKHAEKNDPAKSVERIIRSTLILYEFSMSLFQLGVISICFSFRFTSSFRCLFAVCCDSIWKCASKLRVMISRKSLTNLLFWKKCFFRFGPSNGLDCIMSIRSNYYLIISIVHVTTIMVIMIQMTCSNHIYATFCQSDKTKFLVITQWNLFLFFIRNHKLTVHGNGTQIHPVGFNNRLNSF